MEVYPAVVGGRRGQPQQGNKGEVPRQSSLGAAEAIRLQHVTVQGQPARLCKVSNRNVYIL